MMKIVSKKDKSFEDGINKSFRFIKTCYFMIVGSDDFLGDVNYIKNLYEIIKNKEYDIVKKDWGFYATPSINGRLIDNNYKTALVKNRDLKLYILIVQKNKMKIFKKYLKVNNLKIIIWLNDYLIKK